MIKKINNIIISGSSKNPISIDIAFNSDSNKKSVIIFCHGFKGFKDWGPFGHLSDYFSLRGFVFIKFNFSHNGTTIDNPLEFKDLESFGNNNFCLELDDLGLVIDWITNSHELSKEIDAEKIILFGHSRGGSISILKSNEDSRINKLVTWGSPSDLFSKLPKGDRLTKWKKMNVAYIYNGRTKQNMPMYYQFYENYIENLIRLDVKNAIKNLKIPHLIVHGSDDSTVLMCEAENMKKWNINNELYIVDKADHVFGGFHPYNLDFLTKHLKEAVSITCDFLER